MTTAITPPLTSMRALKAAVRPGTVLACTAHPALPPHDRKVTRVTSQGFYFTPSYADRTHRNFFPWPLRSMVTFGPGPGATFTVAYSQGQATFSFHSPQEGS